MAVHGVIQDGFAHDVEVVAMGIVVAGGEVEPNTFVGVVKCKGYTPM